MTVRNRGRAKLYRIVSKRGEPEAPTLGEAIAASFGASMAPLFEGSSYSRSMRDALKRVISSTRRNHWFDNGDRKFVFLPRGGELALDHDDGVLDDIIQAVLESRPMRARYRLFEGAARTLHLRPLSILIHEHQLYLLADDEAGQLKSYRLSRLAQVNLKKRAFEYPTRASYDPRRLFRDSLGIFFGDEFPVSRVRVRLSSRWRLYAETHRWHRSQHVIHDGDGVVVTMRVHCCPELEQWVLSFGEHAEVLAPTRLRNAVAQRAEATAAIYR